MLFSRPGGDGGQATNLDSAKIGFRSLSQDHSLNMLTDRLSDPCLIFPNAARNGIAIYLRAPASRRCPVGISASKAAITKNTTGTKNTVEKRSAIANRLRSQASLEQQRQRSRAEGNKRRRREEARYANTSENSGSGLILFNSIFDRLSGRLFVQVA